MTSKSVRVMEPLKKQHERARRCPGVAAHACNPRTLEDRGTEVRTSRPAWPTWQNFIFARNTKKKISWAWWRVPVIAATRKAETRSEERRVGKECRL